MTYTDRFTTRFSSFARRSRVAGRPSRSSTPRHEALGLGLGSGVRTLGARPEWR